MTVNQSQADRFLGKYDDRIATFLGMPAVPPDMKIVVLSDTAFHAMTGFETAGHGGQVGHTVYISADTSADELARLVAYETAHAMVSGPDTGDTIGPNGPVGSVSAKDAEAIAGIVTDHLGLQPPGWTPSARQQRFADLTPPELAKVSSDIVNGTFTNIATSVGPGSGFIPAALPGAQGSTPNPVPATDAGSTGGAVSTSGSGGAVPLTPPAGATALPPITLPNGSVVTTNADGTVTVVTSAGVSTTYPDLPAAMAAGVAGTATAAPGTLGNPSRPQERHNTEATFRSTLQGWGIHDSPAMEALILQATNGNWNADRFLAALRDTPEYAAAFPGIGPNMSEAAYKANMKSYQATADKYGINLTDAMKQNLIAGHVRPAIFAARANATVVLDNNKAVFAQFQRQLADAGLPPATRTDLLNHIMGMGNEQFKDVWEGANIAAVAKAQGAPLGEKGINKIQSLGAGMSLSDLVKGTADFANKVRTQMGTQEARSFGLTRSDLLAAEFGGPGAGAASDKLQRVMDTHAAFFAQRFGHTPMQVSQGGFSSIGGQQEQAQVQ